MASRAWQLRRNVSRNDGSCVALAELIGATSATLDRRPARSPGLRCRVAAP